jgi:apolipoprotein N-acyltransferase
VTGLWGVTFLVMAVPAAVAVATRSPGRRLAIAGVAAALLVVTLGFGAWRLARSEDGTAVTVGLAASDVGLRAFATTDPGEALAVVETYATAIEALAARGAQVIVLPEKLVGVTAAYRDDVERRLAEAAARHRVLLVAGLNEIATPSRRNVALVFAADGTSAGRYRKRHHIPGLEAGYAPGDAPLLVSGTQPPWGVAICKDLDFPALGREYAGRGAGLMLVPAWDFVADAWQHERMAAMRAIESGFALARSAKQGLLTVRDARGRLVAAARSDSAPVALLAASVKVRHDATVYARYGDWFAWLCVIGAAAVVVRLVTVTFGRSAREDAWAATA